MAGLYIGCAGWSLPSATRPSFGAGDSMLARYATRFNATEINSSFHRPHRRDTYVRWAASVPAGFRFSVKLPRTITHDARLRGVARELDRFAGEVDGLGRKLAMLLVQLPPSLPFEARTAATFFAMLRRRFDVGIACEARHASWFAPAADALWQRHGVARVAADPPVPDGASSRPGGDARVRYWRWHGAPRVYYSAYDDEALRTLADAMRPLRGTRWAIFDNTAHGHAVTDALRLKAMLERVPGRATATRRKA
ncbi:DUF72 domain-containing protein [Lysobacter arvi]|uniref:DUF72 domain-containing protein n=1 Tax=Lysobacter arvi TaxID=3038776 RepID=A0ABU1C932_9GAMM|nr:DUF72 domain-containing protein [Lysobacter arvi]MDR0181696.1 DUF72 domain-containing protein [Lysobacter arvi]